jgi:hypothetical protein
MATTATQIPFGVSIPDWQRWYGQNQGKTIMVNGQLRTIGSDIGADEMLQAYRNQTASWQPAVQPPVPGDVRQPEARALEQMAQIDPTTEALRQGVAGSYLGSLQQAQAPTAGQFQTYLDMYRQLDPTGYAQRQKMSAAQDAYLRQMQQEAALGAKLSPSTQREVSQAARQAQVARGNVYGTPQLVAEAMQRGTAGEQRQQQRTQNLASALGGYQGYLGSGLGMGELALNLYNQQQANLGQAQQRALSYLGSGQTPYQAGAGYLQTAEQRAATAAQGGPQYNPASLGSNYLSNQQQQYGLDIGSQAQNYFNSLANYAGAGGGATKNRAGSALGGAASGALSGATAGAALGGPYAPVTAAIGGVLGGALGGAGGYFS